MSLTLVDSSNAEIDSSTAAIGKVDDPLAKCLQVVLVFFGINADIDGLKDQLARAPGPLELDDLDAIGERLQFTTRSEQVELESVLEAPTPVILITKQGSPLVYLPREGQEGRMFVPGEGFQRADLAGHADEFSGQILSIRPNQEQVAANTEHMSEQDPIDWFWQPILKHLSSFSEVLVCSLFINMFVVALPLFTLNVYDSVIPNFAEATLFVLAIGVVIALSFDFLLKTMRSYILERVAAKVGTGFDGTLMQRLMMINTENMTLSIGERSNLFRELQGIREFYASKFVPTLVDLPFFVVFLGIIYLISPPLTIIPIVGAIAIIAFNIAIQVPINRSTADHFSSMQKKSTLMIESLAGMQNFKLFNAVGDRLFRWNYASGRAAETTRKNQFLFSAVQNLSMTIMHMVHVFIVVFGVYQIQSGNLTIGGLIACTILSGRAIAPIMNLAGVVSRWKQSRDVLRTIDALFRLPNEAEAPAQRSPKGPLRGDIQMENVRYQYPQQMRPALRDISMTIKPGEKIGLIGPSGAGKSTLASVLTGILNDYEGNIYFGNYGLRAISPAELRRTVAVVPQFPFFISGTIRDNILLGRADVSETALKYAARVSGVEEIIKHCGHGLETEVGEGGSQLSGGQRQAISIARAVLRNPRVLIFDEPTTGLDSVLENHFKVQMEEYLKNRTLIMVTHRTSLLSLVDRLVLLDNGRMVADGPTQTVLQKLGASA
ncbi:MAG: ATP-binding cassette domain-containing protein [Pseudomonadales bacterium]